MKYIAIILLLLNYCFGFAQKPTTYLFIGTYTDAKPDTGIYIYSLSSKTGELIRVANAENITNPSYLDISPNGKYL